MSVETYVRFRPVEPLDKSGGDAAAKARDRWKKELDHNPGVLSYRFASGKIGAPVERREAAASGQPPLDLTIEWKSIEAANGTFANNSLFEFLCGYVAGAPVVVVDGDPQISERPA